MKVNSNECNTLFMGKSSNQGINFSVIPGAINYYTNPRRTNFAANRLLKLVRRIVQFQWY